jgi:hypothetical protein
VRASCASDVVHYVVMACARVVRNVAHCMMMKCACRSQCGALYGDKVQCNARYVAMRVMRVTEGVRSDSVVPFEQPESWER